MAGFLGHSPLCFIEGFEWPDPGGRSWAAGVTGKSKRLVCTPRRPNYHGQLWSAEAGASRAVSTCGPQKSLEYSPSVLEVLGCRPCNGVELLPQQSFNVLAPEGFQIIAPVKKSTCQDPRGILDHLPPTKVLTCQPQKNSRIFAPHEHLDLSACRRPGNLELLSP